MWFMNKVFNPLVALILRSRLHKLMSAALLLITYHGRKSGKAYTLPVQYAQSGSGIYIVPGMPAKKTWWRNLRGGAPVTVFLCGRRLTGSATVLDGATDTALVAEALGFYWQRFPAAGRLHAVQPGTDGQFAPDALQRAALSTVVVRVDLV